MILPPTTLQRPAMKGAIVRPSRTGLPIQPKMNCPIQPVLRLLRTPQQLCLDLQPRQR
jgi:hypothetical protein